MLDFRNLSKEEITKVWEIDRREIIENVYYYENNTLVLKPEYYDMAGWPRGEAEIYTPILTSCFERGGWFYGGFNGDRLACVVVVDSKLIGQLHDMLQLKFLHIHRAYRKTGYGKQLFEAASKQAKKQGARRLYISTTPSENTIGFYLKRGCIISQEPESELFELEPEDIHLEYLLECCNSKPLKNTYSW